MHTGKRGSALLGLRVARLSVRLQRSTRGVNTTASSSPLPGVLDIHPQTVTLGGCPPPLMLWQL